MLFGKIPMLSDLSVMTWKKRVKKMPKITGYRISFSKLNAAEGLIISILGTDICSDGK